MSKIDKPLLSDDDIERFIKLLQEIDAAESGETSIDRGVVMERHYTLNCLTGFENALWDDMKTPT